MPKLTSHLEDKYGNVANLQEDVLYVKLGDKAEAFFFGDGCFVLWGPSELTSSRGREIEGMLRQVEINSLGAGERETLFYRTDRTERFFAGMEGETIILEVAEAEPEASVIRAKLAFSNGIADSVKLAVLENNLHDHIERVKSIPVALANGGKLPVGRAEVLRLTGELLQFRAELNLHSELTDTPEWYWSEPQLEELYHRVTRVLDIRQRAHILNKRLDYANELASVLRSHLGEQHGLKLEWGIIALIAVEVAFETLHWLL